MRRRHKAVVDVMSVPISGNPAVAVVDTAPAPRVQIVECEALVVGGGTGGVAAARALARQGHHVCLLEETDWLGGQLTTQGVSALDEHDYIEQFGGTRSYYALRDAIREYYEERSDRAAVKTSPLNPGSCWVSRLAFEPTVASDVLDDFLQRSVGNGRLDVFLRHKCYEVEASDRVIYSVTALNLATGEAITFRPQIVLDATELGDLLPLCGMSYVVGAESYDETKEPHAQPHEPRPHCVQSFTYTFAMSRRPEGERHVIQRPPGYARNRDGQPYSLRIFVHGGEVYSDETGWLEYDVLERAPGTRGSLWAYRRLIDQSQFGAEFQYDISMFNWPGMDYYRERSLLDENPVVVANALQDAKQVSLGFAYWLQTEAPGAGGYPFLKLEPGVMATSDGLAKFPYIREARRIKATFSVMEQDVSTACQAGPRARHFLDSAGLGWYPIDIHRAGDDDVGVSTRTRPFQIPLGALIPTSHSNLLAAAKNIGTTHITNGCYRLHPVEWNIGESAGLLASFCLTEHMSPRQVRDDAQMLRAFQARLLRSGIPLYWLLDVGRDSGELFEAAQRLAMSQLLESIEDDASLQLKPDAVLSHAEAVRLQERLRHVRVEEDLNAAGITRAELAIDLAKRGIV